MKFSDIETISQGVSDYLSDNKIVDMTEIQRQTYKHIMDNRDIIACSSTGTGKTLAYLIPIINRLKSNTHNIQGNAGSGSCQIHPCERGSHHAPYPLHHLQMLRQIHGSHRERSMDRP